MNFQPTEDRILVKEVEIEEVTPGGLVIPGSSKERHVKHGEVVAVGPGRINDRAPTGAYKGDQDNQPRRFGMTIKLNDKVVFGVRSGTPIKVDGVEYLLMTEFEVLGVLT